MRVTQDEHLQHGQGVQHPDDEVEQVNERSDVSRDQKQDC